jgi:hypothetical protein
MFNYVLIKHKQMSFVSNGGKFKLYTVLNGLIFYRLNFHYGCFNYSNSQQAVLSGLTLNLDFWRSVAVSPGIRAEALFTFRFDLNVIENISRL